MSFFRKALFSTIAIAASAMTVPASAATILFNDLGGAGSGSQARLGFEAAARYWGAVLTDDITVTLNIAFASLGNPNVIGQTGSRAQGFFVDSTYAFLAADATSALDVAAVASLRPLGASSVVAGRGALTMIANDFNRDANGNPTTLYTDTAVRLDADGGFNNTGLAINSANAKALGLSNLSGADGLVAFNSNFAFDFDPRDGISANRIDFIGVAVHEIGHALGFTSGVDDYDFFTKPNGPGTTADLGGAPNLESFIVGSTLDLFRYSGAGQLDWSTSSSNKYFSINGGATELFGDSSFSLGAFNGDQRQASHFKDLGGCSNQIGIMDPNFCFGQMGEVTASDLAAFDAIGYDLDFNILVNSGYKVTSADIFAAYVPEPATWAMMIAGFGLVGGSLRRSRRNAVMLATA